MSTHSIHIVIKGGRHMEKWETRVKKKKVRNSALGPRVFCSVCYKETAFSSHREERILMSLECGRLVPPTPRVSAFIRRGWPPSKLFPGPCCSPPTSPSGCTLWLPTGSHAILRCSFRSWLLHLLCESRNFCQLSLHHL